MGSSGASLSNRGISINANIFHSLHSSLRVLAFLNRDINSGNEHQSGFREVNNLLEDIPKGLPGLCHIVGHPLFLSIGEISLQGLNGAHNVQHGVHKIGAVELVSNSLKVS
jgi:hypothetical protein